MEFRVVALAVFKLILITTAGGLDMEGRCSREHVKEAIALKEASDCQPIAKILKLPLPSNNSVTQMTPQYIEATLCGGGCHNSRQSCVPTHSKIRKVPVILSKCGLSTTGRCEKECTKVEVEEHTACRCACLSEQQECKTPGHVFNKVSCSCQCQDQGPAKDCRDQGRVWNTETCVCSCPPASVKPCSTGFEFDFKSTCACVPKDDSKGSEEEGERVERSQEVNQALHNPKHVEVIIILSLAGIASVFFVIILTLLKNIRQLRDTVKSMSRRHILIRSNRYSDLPTEEDSSVEENSLFSEQKDHRPQIL